jgi:hypothetical protein
MEWKLLLAVTLIYLGVMLLISDFWPPVTDLIRRIISRWLP